MSIFDFFRGEKPTQVPTLTHDDVIATINKDKQISVYSDKPRDQQLTEALQAMAWAAIDNGGVMATADSEADGYGVSTAIPMDMLTWYARQTFIGWQACSIMSTHWLIGRACSMPIDDAIKNGFEITACSSDTSISDDVAKILRESEKKHDLNKRLHNFGFFGRVFGVRVAIFRIDGYTADEYGKPLNLDDVSSERKYKGFALVDPQYCTPVVTNSSNPISDDFMKVTYWQVNGIRYHHSFCVEYIHQEVAQTMRGVYMNAGAISLVQQIYEKVYLAEQAAAEANRLLFSKRVWVRSGDVESALLDQVAFEGKMNFFARAINNFGTLLLGENEQLNKHETSLQEVTGVIGQKFEHVSAVSGIPCNRLMMTQLTGFAASGEAEEKIYLDMVSNIQCNQLVPVVEMHTRLTLLSHDLPADDFEVTFNPATSFTAKELADINSQKAQTDSTLAQIQAISPEAIAEKWAKDPHGGYAGIDLADYAAQEQDDFNADMDGLEAVETADAAKWVTVGGGTSAETGQGTGRHFQIDTETGKILKGGGASMQGKTFKEAFSDDNKTLTERQKLSRRITAHAAKKHGGDKGDFTRLTNKGAEGKSSDWHAKEFLKSGDVPSEYGEQPQQASSSPVLSNNLTKDENGSKLSSTSQSEANNGESKMNKQDFLEKHFPHAAKNIQATKGGEYHDNNVDFHLNSVMKSSNNEFMKPISQNGGGEYSAIQQSNFIKAVNASASENKTALSGSEKQIEWANGIRDKAFQKLNYLKSVLENINYDAMPVANHDIVKKSVESLMKNISEVKGIDSAKKWIDIKSFDLNSPLINPARDKTINGVMTSAQNDKYQKAISTSQSEAANGEANMNSLKDFKNKKSIVISGSNATAEYTKDSYGDEFLTITHQNGKKQGMYFDKFKKMIESGDITTPQQHEKQQAEKANKSISADDLKVGNTHGVDINKIDGKKVFVSAANKRLDLKLQSMGQWLGNKNGGLVIDLSNEATKNKFIDLLESLKNEDNHEN